MSEAEQMVAALTKAQKAALPLFSETPIWWFPAHVAKVTRERLVDAGLLEKRTVNPRDFPLPMVGLCLTALGKDVVAILQGTPS